MDAAVIECITALHAQPTRWALVLTGGGIHLAAWLLSVPGASRTILEVQTPYDTPATDAYLGAAPESYCSPETAILLAQRARQRAQWLAPRQPVRGLGATASLVSERTKRGEHRIHLAIADDTETHVWSLTLNKGARTRQEEDTAAAALGLHALARSLGLPAPPVPLLAGEQLHTERQPLAAPLAQFHRREVNAVCLLPDGRQGTLATLTPLALVPGSFNPLHDGHRALSRLAESRVGQPAAFEMSIENVEKPPLEPGEVAWRAAAFRWRETLWLTRAPRFLDKARLFPGILFVVGADTALRLVQARFYQDRTEQMQSALDEMRSLGCRFLVAGRVNASGTFQGLDQLPIPEAYRDLFIGIGEHEFRLDVSSTALRARSTSGT